MSPEAEEPSSPSLTSLENMPIALERGKSHPTERLVQAVQSTDPSSKGAAALESQLEELKSEQKIERFFWILAVVILSDVIVFKFEDAWTSNIFVGLLSLVMLIGCARWLEVPWVYIPLARIFDRFIGAKQSTPKIDEVEEI